MKNLVKSIAIVAFTVGTISFATAQKIAHISLDSLITSMAESKTAQEVAQKYLKDLETQVATMDSELQTKYAAYMKDNESGTMSALVKTTRESELQDLNKRIEDFKGQAQQDYQRKYGELSKPIYDKAKKAIDLVAKENGYKYVLDTSSGNVLYSEPSDDILSLVSKKLETMPAAQIPGATPKAPGTNKPAGTVKQPAGGK